MSELSWVFPEDRSDRIKAIKEEMAQSLKKYMHYKRLLSELESDEAEDRPLSLIAAVADQEQWYAQPDPEDDDLYVWRQAFKDEGPDQSGLDVNVPV